MDLTQYRLDKIDATLESVLEKLDNVIEEQHAQKTRTAVMEIKSGLFGTLGGVFSVALVVLIEWFKGKILKGS